MPHIWPSLISADLLHLASVMDRLSTHVAGWHIDVMDNHFVPNLTWGAAFANAITDYSDKPLWVHLMIERPEQFIDRLTISKDSYITIHCEATISITAAIDAIKQKGCKVGLAIHPETSVETLFPYIAMVDQLLVMSVNPGFSGQRFIESSIERISVLKHEITRTNSSTKPLLAADGGVNEQNIGQLAQLGVTQFAIASGLFTAPDMIERLQQLERLVSEVR